jgi:hypothetical protein
MPAVYIHFFGAESSKSLLEARGIISRKAKEDIMLQTKECPHCREPNTAHAKFCNKCKMVLTYDGYAQTIANQKTIEAELKDIRARLDKYERIDKEAEGWHKVQTDE